MLVGQTQTFPDGTTKYSEYRLGGTSLSSPLMAGVMALADQQAGHHHGFANPALYAQYGTPAYRDTVAPDQPIAVVRNDFVELGRRHRRHRDDAADVRPDREPGHHAGLRRRHRRRQPERAAVPRRAGRGGRALTTMADMGPRPTRARPSASWPRRGCPRAIEAPSRPWRCARHRHAPVRVAPALHAAPATAAHRPAPSARPRAGSSSARRRRRRAAGAGGRPTPAAPRRRRAARAGAGSGRARARRAG